MLELDWTPLALLPLAALVAGWGFAIIVFLVGPSRPVNRFLALVLFVEGSLWGLTNLVHGLVQRPGDAFAALAVGEMMYIAVSASYLAFLGVALDTRIVRPFATRSGRVALATLAVLAALVVLARPRWFVARVVPDPLGIIGWVGEWGPGDAVLTLVFVVALTTGLVAAWRAYRRTAPASLARRRARAFFVAFGLRDAFFAAVFVLFGIIVPQEQASAPLVITVLVVTYAVLLAYLALLAHGILRTQLLDIDVKLRWTVKQSTVAALFIAVFFVVSELSAEVLTERTGTVVGILAAGALLFALAPVQRLAERVAARAVPPTPSLDAAERGAIYRDTVLQAWSDGALDKSERLMLDRLRDRLGLSRDEASRIESDVAGG